MGRASFLLLFLVFSQLYASDQAKEQRWADQVVDSIMDGDEVWLEADGNDFLSIYTSAEEESDKGLIVMHGTGVHPNWNQIIQPVRVGMTERGWNTISIQMPVLQNEASHDDYAVLFPEVSPRINAAKSYLESKGIQKIVLVGHSLGSLMASYHLSKHQSRSIKGFIAIGMPGGSKHEVMNSLHSLKSISVPVFDLFGSEDLEEVLAHRKTRKLAAGHTSFDQLEVDGANHFFDDKDEALIDAINGWLRKKQF